MNTYIHIYVDIYRYKCKMHIVYITWIKIGKCIHFPYNTILYTYLHVNVCKHTSSYKYAYLYVCIHTYICMYIHIYTHIYVYIN